MSATAASIIAKKARREIAIILNQGVEIESDVRYPIGVDPFDTYRPFVATAKIVIRVPGMRSIVIDRNDRSDSASLPRFSWMFMGFVPTGPWLLAGFAHDKAYQTYAWMPGHVRAVYDAMFYAILVALNEHADVIDAQNGVGTKRRWWSRVKRKVRATLAYWGVRLGGWVAWNRYAAASAKADAEWDT